MSFCNAYSGFQKWWNCPKSACLGSQIEKWSLMGCLKSNFTTLMKNFLVPPLFQKGTLGRVFAFFFSLERFPVSILVVWPRERYQINPQNILNKHTEPIFDWRSQKVFWDLRSSRRVPLSHLRMLKWVKKWPRKFRKSIFEVKKWNFLFDSINVSGMS